MSPHKSRPTFAGNHPVERHDSIFLTPPIEALANTMKRWMEAEISGGLVFGHQRYGKTRAARALVKQWTTIAKCAMPAYLIDVRTRNVPNEDGFFEDFLVGVGHEYPAKGKAKDKRNRVRDFLVCEAQRMASDKVLLVVDNAHRLDQIHYDWLCNLFDELDAANILAFTVSVGEPDLKSIREGFESAGQMQSVGRFMVEEHWFRGIHRQKDLERVLGWFDTKIFPEGSGWSYSRYYYPEAFDSGWRLLREAPLVWSLWETLHSTRKLHGPLEIPMMYLSSVIRRILRKGGELDSPVFQGSADIWRPLIVSSGYATAARYVRVITGESP